MAIFGALAPILIPAAIGAVTSAAFGKNPLQGAVMGGVSGGLLGGGFGDLFKLGSEVGKTAATTAGTAGTAFGASQAPLANTSLLAPEAITSTAMNNAYTGPVSSTVGGIHTGAGVPSDVALSNLGNKSMMQATNLGRPADYIAPLPENTVQFDIGGQTDNMVNAGAVAKYPDYSITPEKIGKSADYTGGGAEVAEKPLYERAYESVINYAQKNPLEIAGLGLMASGGIRPRQPQISGASVGSITKGTPPQQAGQILQVRRPTRFA